MKIRCGKIVELWESIRQGLRSHSQLKVDKRVASNLAKCAACVLASQSSNSSEWIAVLPRNCDKKAKELYIRRVLSSPLIDVS
jgi:hypothetical protein